jgi:uncharacterized protein YndB with AHSA1/START domain
MKTNESFGQQNALGEVTFIRLLPGPIERTWDYLIDSDRRGQWLASGAIEPKLGGNADLHFHHADLSEEKTPPAKHADMAGGFRMACSVTTFEPPHLLGLIWNAGDQPSEVIFRLATHDDSVRLVLTQRHLPTCEERMAAASGWHAHLDVLLARLDDRSPPPFWSRHAKLESDYALLFAEKEISTV